MELKLAQKLALDLLKSHGLTEKGWSFEFDNAVSRFGVCSYTKRRILISRKLTVLNTEEEVTNTILHEVAHALVGPGAGHSHKWRRVAQSIGCTGSRTHSAETPQAPWMGTCPSGHTITRHRLTDTAKNRVACAKCCNSKNNGRFSAEYKFNWMRVA